MSTYEQTKKPQPTFLGWALAGLAIGLVCGFFVIGGIAAAILMGVAMGIAMGMAGLSFRKS